MAKPKAKKASSSSPSESSASEQKKKKRKAKKDHESKSEDEEKPAAKKKKEDKKDGKEKAKEKEKVKDKAKSKEKEAEKPKPKEKDEDKPKKDKAKEKEKDGEKTKEKEKDADKQKDREKDGDKPKDRDKDGDKVKEKEKLRQKVKSKDEEQSEVEDGSDENGPEMGADDLLVKIDMTEKKGLGIEVDWANGTSLRIKDVKKEGAIPDWNKGRAPNQSVCAEDHIISVNGKTGDPKAMLAECRTKKKLKFVVWAHCQRPAEMPSKSRSPKRKSSEDPKNKLADAEAALAKSLAKVHRRGAAQHLEFMVSLDMSRHTLLGVDADFSNGKTLFIKSIIPGAVEEWNKGCPSGRAVEAGFQIVAVNGYAGDAQGMAGLCKELCDANSHLQLRIRGLPPPPSPQAVS